MNIIDASGYTTLQGQDQGVLGRLSTLVGCDGLSEVLPGLAAERAELHKNGKLLLGFVSLSKLKIKLP